MMAGEFVMFVGGPLHGLTMERPTASSISVPVFGLGSGAAVAVYTMRRCRNAGGGIVEVLAEAGRDIDPKWLKANGLTN